MSPSLRGKNPVALIWKQTPLPRHTTQSEIPAVREAPPAVREGPPRGTQSFVAIIARCRRRPSLLALELLWRWLFGLPLLAVLAWQGARIWARNGPAVLSTGVASFSLQFPIQGSLAIAEAWSILWPPVARTLLWLLPSAVLAWALAAGLGRNLVLRRYSPALPWRPFASVALQLLRIAALCATWAAWFASIRWAAQATLSHVTTLSETAAEPSLVLYCALVIVLTLGFFVFWLLLSWTFSIAPLLVLLEGGGIGRALARSLRLGPLAGKLAEINLVMGIVKLALIVLAMVFSAIPLPFEAEVHGAALYAWWAVVSLLYLLASDFFQVARTIAFVELWKLVPPTRE